MQLVESNPTSQEFSSRKEVYVYKINAFILLCKCEINMVEK